MIIFRNIELNALPREDGFWESIAAGLWEQQTFDIFDFYLKPDKSFIDIGAWIGPTTLYAAHKSCHCYCIEPDPVAYNSLVKNIKLNNSISHKISSFCCCIGNATGDIKMGCPGNQGSSISGLFWATSENSWNVRSYTLSDFININQIYDFNFIKIDIEGGESIVIPESIDVLKKYKPTIFLSLHYQWFENPSQDIKNIVDVIRLYPYLYDREGNLINIKDVLKGIDMDHKDAKNSDILATNIKYFKERSS